ncbi:MAG: hypothetical protein ACI4KR_09505 [Ruminiclostridium sp.]
MKKTTALIIALAAILSAAGCSSTGVNTAKTTESTTATTTAAETTTAPEQTAATKETTEKTTTAETTTTPEEISSAEETTQPDSEDKTLIWTAPDGTELYAEDASNKTEYYLEYDIAFARPATGIYYDSSANPELFDAENYEYSGEYVTPEGYKPVKAGDSFGGHTINYVQSIFSTYTDADGNLVTYPMSNTIEITENVTLTGTIRFFRDDQYAVTEGDIFFFPDSSYKDMPHPDLSGRETQGTPDFFLLNDYAELGEGVSLFTDSPRFLCGNLYENYGDNAEVNTAVDGGQESCSKKVRITFSGMLIEWSDQFGISFSHGTIKNIEVIE